MANEEKTPSKKNEGSEPVGPRRPLLRSKNNRLIWGVAGAFAAGVRRQITAWLLTAALVLGIPAGAIAAADINIDGSIGERTYTPTLPTDIPADGYKLGTGQLIVDLR